MTIPNKKVIVYSVNLGNYDRDTFTHIEQTYPDVTYRVYKSDVDNIASDARNDYEASKRFRMGTPYLKNLETFDIAIYLDANVQIIDPSFVETIVNDHNILQWDFLMSNHESCKIPLDEIELAKKRQNKYSLEGLDRMKHLVEDCHERVSWCGFNAQWLKSPRYNNLKLIFEDWWNLVRVDPIGVANDQVVWPLAYYKSKETYPIFFREIAQQYTSLQFFKLHFVNHGQPPDKKEKSKINLRWLRR